jgi:flavin reductase (DIM6/NTAB) family NADH-FMN oxidoreductase RutF
MTALAGKAALHGDAHTEVTEAFLAAFRRHPAGVAIITGDPGGGPVALTVSSLISVSVEPPTVAFSLSEASSSARALMQAETVVLHFVLRRNMQLARLCATSGTNRFGPDTRWERLPTGEPFYPDVDLRFRAAIRGRLPVPGAFVVTAELLSVSPGKHAEALDDALVYADRAWHGLRPLADTTRAPLLLWPDDSATF